MYAFVEKEECSKEEETRRQSREITSFIFCVHAGFTRSSATPLNKVSLSMELNEHQTV